MRLLQHQRDFSFRFRILSDMFSMRNVDLLAGWDWMDDDGGGGRGKRTIFGDKNSATYGFEILTLW